MPHPVEDFLFEYYPYPFSLAGELASRVSGSAWKSGRVRFPSPFSDKLLLGWTDGFLFADPGRLSTKERQRLKWIAELLEATRDRLPNFACHGLHEWAMVYRGKEVRHEKTTHAAAAAGGDRRAGGVAGDLLFASRRVPVFRRGGATAEPLAAGLWKAAMLLEQPGCLHANMDLYKWAAKSMPWIGSELLLDCFELAMELRDLDMRASPYDLTDWGREPVRIETAEGRRIYETEQRRLAERPRRCGRG